MRSTRMSVYCPPTASPTSTKHTDRAERPSVTDISASNDDCSRFRPRAESDARTVVIRLGETPAGINLPRERGDMKCRASLVDATVLIPTHQSHHVFPSDSRLPTVATRRAEIELLGTHLEQAVPLSPTRSRAVTSTRHRPHLEDHPTDAGLRRTLSTNSPARSSSQLNGLADVDQPRSSASNPDHDIELSSRAVQHHHDYLSVGLTQVPSPHT